MTLKVHNARKLALLGAAAIATLGGVAAPAQAAVSSTTLNYSCTYPFIGAQNVSATVGVDFPSTVTAGVLTPGAPITTVTTAADAVTDMWEILDAASVDSVTTTQTIFTASGQTVTVAVPQASAGSDPLVRPFVIDAAGTTPSLMFKNQGPGRISVGTLHFELLARNSSGDVIVLDQDGTDSFGVDCAQLAGQDAKLARFTVKKAR